MGHLQDINQNYFTHLYNAFFYSYTSLKASIIFFIHGLFPDLLVYSGSSLIEKLNKTLQDNKVNLMKKLN